MCTHGSCRAPPGFPVFAMFVENRMEPMVVPGRCPGNTTIQPKVTIMKNNNLSGITSAQVDAALSLAGLETIYSSPDSILKYLQGEPGLGPEFESLVKRNAGDEIAALAEIIKERRECFIRTEKVTDEIVDNLVSAFKRGIVEAGSSDTRVPSDWRIRMAARVCLERESVDYLERCMFTGQWFADTRRDFRSMGVRINAACLPSFKDCPLMPPGGFSSVGGLCFLKRTDKVHYRNLLNSVVVCMGRAYYDWFDHEYYERVKETL